MRGQEETGSHAQPGSPGVSPHHQVHGTEARPKLEVVATHMAQVKNLRQIGLTAPGSPGNLPSFSPGTDFGRDA